MERAPNGALDGSLRLISAAASMTGIGWGPFPRDLGSGGTSARSIFGRSKEMRPPVLEQFRQPGAGHLQLVRDPNPAVPLVAPAIVLHCVAEGRWRRCGEGQATGKYDPGLRWRLPPCGLLRRLWRPLGGVCLQPADRLSDRRQRLPAGFMGAVDLGGAVPERRHGGLELGAILVPDPEVHLHQAELGPAFPQRGHRLLAHAGQHAPGDHKGTSAPGCLRHGGRATRT